MPPEDAFTSEDMNKQVVADFLKDKKKFSNKTILIIVLIFAALGAFLLWRSFAATAQVAKIEAEQMQFASTPYNSQSITDSAALNGSAMKYAWGSSNNGSVTTTSPLNIPTGTSVSSVQVRVRGQKCNGGWPYVSIIVDGTTLFKKQVATSTYATYSANYSMGAGSHTVKLKSDNLGNTSCPRNLYADVIGFYGSVATPAPTIAFSASPTSITAGSASTLTWTSTNATSCTAGGAWSGAQATSGNITTGALNTTSTYNLSCTGAGGSASGSATVNVTTPTTTTTTTTSSGSGGANMIVGLQTATAWGSTAVARAAAAVKYVRLDASIPSNTVGAWKTAGVQVDLDLSGNYNTSGVSGLGDPTTWANSQLGTYRSLGCDPTECPMIEVLNEPGGMWFWGSSALSQTNADAYAKLINATYDVFHAAYGSSAPKVLATYDGSSGANGVTTWGKEWWNSAYANHSKVDGIVVHPYGLTSVPRTPDSANGNRTLVASAHNDTAKPMYVTEVGWPTAVGQPNTGDSYQWSETEQANNLYNFITWARGTGYVNAVMYFQYHDYGTNNWYGVVRSDGSIKPSYYSLQCAAQSKTWDTSALTCH